MYRSGEKCLDFFVKALKTFESTKKVKLFLTYGSVGGYITGSSAKCKARGFWESLTVPIFRAISTNFCWSNSGSDRYPG